MIVRTLVSADKAAPWGESCHGSWKVPGKPNRVDAPADDWACGRGDFTALPDGYRASAAGSDDLSRHVRRRSDVPDPDPKQLERHSHALQSRVRGCRA